MAQQGAGRPTGIITGADGLTDRQRAVLNAVRDLTAASGYPPTMREIGAATGLSSTSSVAHHVNTLEKAGLLRRDPHRPRAYCATIADDTDDQAPLGTTSGARAQRVVHVPLIGHVAAGRPIPAQRDVDDLLPLPAQLVGEGNLYGLIVRGDSMIGAHIADGDTVIVREQPTAHHGDIVAALLGDEATIKRLHRTATGYWLMPANDACRPIDARHARVLGKVVAVLRHL